MKSNKLRQMAEDPTLISGIYNYCDRWCERCSFTDRCLNYRTEQEARREAAEKKDTVTKTGAELWQDVKKTLDDTIELLKELMRERGMDPEKMETDETYLVSEDEIRKNTKAHPLTRMSQTYITLTQAWVEGHEQVLAAAGALEDSPPEDPGTPRYRLWDASQIIRWYLFQINVKIQRALQGKQRDEVYPHDAFGKDSDGSAKVALLGIDRSLQAWHTLLELFPAEEDTIADIMILLGTLRKNTEEVFPGARSFRRPGFDEDE